MEGLILNWTYKHIPVQIMHNYSLILLLVILNYMYFPIALKRKKGFRVALKRYGNKESLTESYVCWRSVTFNSVSLNHCLNLLRLQIKISRYYKGIASGNILYAYLDGYGLSTR